MNQDAGGSGETVEVDILGEVYSIKSETGEEYTRQVARHVDEMAREVRRDSGVVDQKKLAILTALAITDQLFRMREGVEKVKQVTEKRAERLAARVLESLEGGGEK